MHKKPSRNISTLLFVTVIITLILSSLVGYIQFNQAFQTNQKIVTSYKIIQAANQSMLSINEAALEVSTLLYTHDIDVIKNLHQIIVSAQVNLATLSQLTQNNFEQNQIFKNLNISATKKINFLNKIISEYLSGNQNSAILIASDKTRLQLSNDIIQLIIDIKRIESSHLAGLFHESLINKSRTDIFYVSAAIINVLLLILSFASIRKNPDNCTNDSTKITKHLGK